MSDEAEFEREPAPLLSLDLPTTTFSSEEALAEVLESEQRAAPEQYLYRGQAAEYRRRWPLSPGPFRPLTTTDLENLALWRFEPKSLMLPVPLERGMVDLPSLIPTNTRAYEHYVRDGPAGWREDAFDDMMVYFWTAVCTFILGLACRVWRDTPALNWVLRQWDEDFPALYKLRSVGQHYGMDTGLLDATSSFKVALWFATHDFSSGEYRAHDSAVIYRIDRHQLPEVEAWLRAIPEHEGEFDAASVDIRDTPETIAPRAVRQEGWSLVGWDHPRMIIRMASQGFLTRYVTRTGSSPSPANDLTRDYLLPVADPTGILFRIYWPEPLRSLEDAQAWIDRYWNIDASRPIVLDEDGSWMARLVDELENIYKAHTASVRKGFAHLFPDNRPE